MKPDYALPVRLRPVWWTAFLLLTVTGVARSELKMPSWLSDRVTLTGQAGVYGELYDVNGTSSRRPPSTSRLALTPTLTFSNYLTISLDLLLSTEGSRARQNMNVMGLHPTWSWGRAHLGDFSDRFSQFTFNGVNVKGAGIDLYPGKFRFSFGGGQTRRAVEGTVINQSYEQNLYTGRVGYGDRQGTHLDLIVVKIQDDPKSITGLDSTDYPVVNPDTLENPLDTLWIEPPYNPYAVTPQENLVAGLSARVQMLRNRLTLDLEASGSAFTKDLNSEKITVDSLETSDFFRNVLDGVYTPRRSSAVDYAFNAQVEGNFNFLKAGVGYRYIGPGYVSLGIPSTVNDRREFLTNASLNLGMHQFQIQWNRMSDNLLGQKVETNVRHQIRASVRSNLNRWRSTINVQILNMNNDAGIDTLSYQYSNTVLSTNQALVFGPESWIRQVGLQYNYQQSDKDLHQSDSRSVYHTLNLTGSMRIVGLLLLNVSTGLSFRNTPEQGDYTSQVYSLRLSHTAFKNRLNTTLFSSSSMIRDSRMLRLGLNSGFRLTKQDLIRFNLTYNLFRGTRDFEEFRTSLDLSHRL